MISVKDHEYTALFNFENHEEPKVLLMTAKSYCPMVKFRENLINFGDCDVNLRKDFHLNVYNYHYNLPVVIKCPNKSHFLT